MVSSETTPSSPSLLIFFHSGEVLPACGHAADAAFAAVGEHDQGVVPKELRNRFLVVAKIAGVGCLQPGIGRLQLDEHQRNAVDEAYQVGSPGVHLPGHPELADQ